MKNQVIITEFEKLIKQISSDVDNAKDHKTRLANTFRLKQIAGALHILINFKDDITNSNQLNGIKGIGKGILGRIDEILKNGYLKEINLQNEDIEIAKQIDELKEIYGIGDKLASELVKKHNIHTVDELIKEYRNGNIELNNNVVTGLKYYKVYEQKIPREEVKKMETYLKNSAKQIDEKLKVKICGSYRRKRPFSNDIDCMLIHPDIKTMDDVKNNKNNYLHKFIEELRENLFIVDALTGDDVETKFMGFCRLTKKLPIRRIDIRYIPFNSYYSALLYFTGNGTFNQDMRKLAKKNGYKLNEYGLYKKTGEKYKQINISSEEEIFKILEMDYVKPEDRNY